MRKNSADGNGRGKRENYATNVVTGGFGPPPFRSPIVENNRELIDPARRGMHTLNHSGIKYRVKAAVSCSKSF